MAARRPARKAAQKPASTGTEKRSREQEAARLDLDKLPARLRVDWAIELLGRLEKPGRIVQALVQGNETARLPGISEGQAWLYYRRAVQEMESAPSSVTTLKALAVAKNRLEQVVKLSMQSSRPSSAVGALDRIALIEQTPTPLNRQDRDIIPGGAIDGPKPEDQRAAILGRLAEKPKSKPKS